MYILPTHQLLLLRYMFTLSMMSNFDRFVSVTRIRLKNFVILGNERQLYENTEQTGVCPYNNDLNIPIPSICDVTLAIPVNNGTNINNITIAVPSHKNDNNYQFDRDFNKGAILAICEVEIYAGKIVNIRIISDLHAFFNCVDMK